MIQEFLEKFDELWIPLGIEPIGLDLIGSAALLLQMDYVRGTKDTDILEISELPAKVWEQLKELAGKGTPLAKKYRLYVDLVKPAVPFLPPNPQFHPSDELNRSLKNFRIRLLDPLDVVISKLKPFRAADLEDIRAVVDRNLVDAVRFVERFELAKQQWLMGSRGPGLRQCVDNLHMVQRDLLFVEETPIDLPEWLEDL